MSAEACRFLRPCINRGIRTRANPAYVRFFSAYRQLCAKDKSTLKPQSRAQPPVRSSTADYEKRLAQLQAYTDLNACYPRLSTVNNTNKFSIKTLREKSGTLDSENTDRTTPCSISGILSQAL